MVGPIVSKKAVELHTGLAAALAWKKSVKATRVAGILLERMFVKACPMRR